MKSPLPNNRRYGIPALSWSDVVAIENDVHRWYLEQIGQRRKITNEAMDFGTHVHARIAKGELDVPRGNSPETVYRYKTKHFTIIGKPDDADDETIYEYKTVSKGKHWTLNAAQQHGQLFTYALLRWKNGHPLPKKALLVSIETAQDEDAGRYLTGDILVHEVPVTLLPILKIQTRFNAAFEKVKSYVRDRANALK